MRDATLLLVFRGSGSTRELLLAKKKRGFGMDKWNGPGGKIESALGESAEDGVIREAKEEVGIIVQSVDKVGTLDFIFPHAMDKNFHCFLFTSTDFLGEATESEEMAPKWFKVSEIPYKSMWDDDKFWLPLVLQGKKITGSVTFDEYGLVTGHTIRVVA